MMSGGNRFPFTASQWQELEHQALIFKYMVSGIPIPSDLLFTIKRSCLVDSTLSSKLFPRQSPHIGWNCFQMGLGRKIDPEPGRCRRTDGKKWRCSKEAYPDSKYCERHMHRGKNRSRKPVEAANQTATIDPIAPVTAKNHSAAAGLLTPPSHSLSLLSSDHQSHHRNQNQLHYSAYNNTHTAHLNHHFLSSSRDNSTPLLFDSAGSCSLTNSDYRNAYGLKEEVDEHAFFSESSGSVRTLNDPWQFTPLTMSSSSSSSSSNQRSFLNNEYSYLQLHSLNDQENAPKHEKQYHQQQQQSYFLGMKNGREQQGEPQKTVHQFFDELPLKNKDSWLDLDDKNSTSSTTRLSISIPSSSHEFPIFNSRTHNDG